MTNSSAAVAPVWVTHHTWLTAWFVIMISLCIFGALLNFLLFSAIVSSKKLRSGSGLLIAHAILVDSLMCSVVIPPIIASTWIPQYVLPSKNMCRVIMLIFYGAAWSSNWALVPIAANRFIAVCFPHQYNCWVTRPCRLIIVVCGWLVSIACALAVFFGVGAELTPIKPWEACGPLVTDRTSYIALTLVGTTVPALLQGATYLSLFTYASIQKVVRRKKVNGSVVNGNRLRIQALQSRRVRTTKMVFAAYVWSVVCNLTAPVASTASPVLFTSEPLLSLLSRMILLVGYATSPVSSFCPFVSVWASIERVCCAR